MVASAATWMIVPHRHSSPALNVMQITPMLQSPSHTHAHVSHMLQSDCMFFQSIVFTLFDDFVQLSLE